jgi:DNA-binding transcriptional LysR family regulator
MAWRRRSRLRVSSSSTIAEQLPPAWLASFRAPAALSVSTTAAVRAAVLAGAAPAVISDLAVADDLAAGRLAEVRTPGLDLRRTLRVIWAGTANPTVGPARDLVAHIASRATSPRRVAPWQFSSAESRR